MIADLPAIRRRYEVALHARLNSSPPFRAALIEASAKDVPALLANDVAAA